MEAMNEMYVPAFRCPIHRISHEASSRKDQNPEQDPDTYVDGVHPHLLVCPFIV